LFRRVVAEGAASIAFIPVFTNRLVKEGRASALRASAAVGAAASVILLFISALGMLFADEIVSVFAPGFAADPAKRALTVELTRLTFPYLLLVGMAAWAMGTLHTFRRFAAPAAGPILLNLSMIAAVLGPATRFERPLHVLCLGVLAGGLLQIAVQLPSLAAVGLRFKMLFASFDRAVSRVGRLLVPALFGGAVYQVNILVATLFASLLPSGSVSWLWYADRLFEFPLGIVAVAVGTAVLPSLSSQAGGGRLGAMADSLGYSLRLVWSLCIPATLGLWLLAPLLVSVLFERGSFGAVDSQMTAWALRAYVCGLLAVASVRVLVAPFYALEKPRLPVQAALVALVVNALADLALMGPTDPGAPWWGAAAVAAAAELVAVADLRHAGLALGTAIAALANALVLLFFLRSLLPQFRLAACASSVGRHTLAAIAMAAGIMAWQAWATERGLGDLLQLAVAAGGGFIAYIGVALALGSSELRGLISSVRRRN
jgi:putative peptidoglycan lipid II flippase